MNDLSYMDENYKGIHGRILQAANKAGKNDVTLVAAVKYTDGEHINYLHEKLGVNDVGENRVQQLLEHWETVNRENLRFHFIGTLQTNKVKYIIDKVCMIHSLDSENLAAEIEKQAAKKNLIMDVLVEINSGNEESKSGIPMEQAEAFCRKLEAYPHLRWRGFMTMAPKCEDTEAYRGYFRETYRRGLDIWQKITHNIDRPIFSMGMSGSFEVAIEEGADIVRVGRALFAEPDRREDNITK